MPSSERLPGEYFVKYKFQKWKRYFYHLIVGSCLHAFRNSSIVTSPSLLPHSFWDSRYGNQGWPCSCGRWLSCHRWPTCQLLEKFRSQGLQSWMHFGWKVSSCGIHLGCERKSIFLDTANKSLGQVRFTQQYRRKKSVLAVHQMDFILSCTIYCTTGILSATAIL